MSLIGKIIGGGVGFFVGGPIGAVAGAVAGHHLLDKEKQHQHQYEPRPQPTQSEYTFFITVFWVMGHISKADGRVSQEEIDFVTRVMEWMDLDAENREFARNLFTEGRDSPVGPDGVLDQMKEHVDDPQLIDNFIRIQIDAAYADGHLDPRERKILDHIQHRLNLPPDTVDSILQGKAQFAFFTATFWVMGHVSKVDGQVSPEEIDFAMSTMEWMDLDEDDRKAAREIFTDGRDSSVALDDVLDQLRRECDDSGLIELFLRIQVDAAMADEDLHPRERDILEHIQHRLGLPGGTVDSILEAGFGDTSNDDWAYETLELEDGCSQEDIKRAYRQLTSKYHPDKMVSKGLPEEMVQFASEKTRKIRSAYEHLRQQNS